VTRIAEQSVRRVVHYEFPLTEGMRTWLRLGMLLDRLDGEVAGGAGLDHHHALATMFEIADIGARVELKGELLRELERHRAALAPLREHPAVDRAALESTLQQLQVAHDGLSGTAGKLGHQLAANEFLVGIKSRISIPAGTCEFDLPAYHAWKQWPASRRRGDLQRWLQPLAPYARSIRLVVDLVRRSGTPRREIARAGHHQMTLGSARPVVLVRVGVEGDGDSAAIPEVSGHRLLLSIRMLAFDSDGQVRPRTDDVGFEIALCAGP
jgi:cell division protein ZapD